MPIMYFARFSSILLIPCLLLIPLAVAQTGYIYQLDTEYTGASFFNGWDFFTGGDPTGGFVDYVNEQTALQYGFINSSDSAPVYMGVDHAGYYSTSGGGRPSVRISTQKQWTHGLFIGDFNHQPGGVCGTWPAFWTIGPNWPYNGEIDILEGVNLLTNNVMSLHTHNISSSLNYELGGTPSTETGTLEATDCTVYVTPYGDGNTVGCGVSDPRTTSYGTGFNQNGGGVYAMQWTSDYIKIWFFPNETVPQDITNKVPNPSGWGLPVGYMAAPGDQPDLHFADHSITFDTTFCGSFAGVADIWNATSGPSCAVQTGYSTCNAFVAGNPSAFQQAYWSVNSVRVYQLLAAGQNATSYSTSSTSTTSTSTAPSTPTPTINSTTTLCPNYNYTVINYGGSNYEIECSINIAGSDLGLPYANYPVTSFEDCLGACNYWTANNKTTCTGVEYVISNKACYPKSSTGSYSYNSAQNGARLIFAGYGAPTDIPPSTAAGSTSSTSSISTSSTSSSPASVAPVHYSNPTAVTSSMASNTESVSAAGSLLGLGMGGSANTSTVILTSSSSQTPSATSFSAMTFSSGLPNTSVTSKTPTATAPSSSTVQSTSSSSTTQSSASYSSSSVLSSSSAPVAPSSMSPSTTSTSFQTSSSVLTSSSTSSSSPSTSSTSSPQSSSTSSGVITSSSASMSPSSTPVTASTSTTSSSTPTSSNTTASSLAPSSSSSTTTVIPTFGTGTIVVTVSEPTSGNGPSTIVVTVSEPISAEGTSTIFGTGTIVVTMSEPTSANSLGTTVVTTVEPSLGASTIDIESSSVNGASTITVTTISSISSPSSSSAPTSTPTSSGTPAVIANFNYTGCYGYTVGGHSGFQLAESLSTMSLNTCLDDCAGDAYAGVSDDSCYCAAAATAIQSATKYPDSDCNTPCPGNASQTCGGVYTATERKRQSIVLLTVYEDPVVIQDQTNPDRVSSSAPAISSSNTSPAGITPVMQSPTLTPSASASHTALPASITPSLPGLSSNISTLPTLTPIRISTTYIDVCGCDAGLTTTSTVLTTLHCGCTETPVPTVPMTTSVKACSACAAGMATVTVPDESAIAYAATGGAAVIGNGTASGMSYGKGGAAVGRNGTATAAFTPAGAGATPVEGAGAANITNAAAVPGPEPSSDTGTSSGPGNGVGEASGSGAGSGTGASASASVLAQLEYGNSTIATSTFGLQSTAPFQGAAANLRSSFVGVVFMVIVRVMVS